MSLRTVVIELLADTTSLKKGLAVADKGTARLSKSLKATAAAGGVLAAIFAAKKVVKGILNLGEATHDIVQTARGLRFATNEYEKLTFAFDRVGVSANTVRGSVSALEKQLANPKAAKLFKAIGLSQKALLKQAPSAAFESVLQAFRNVPDELLAGTASGIFGGSGADLAKTIRQWKDFAQARRDYDRVVGRGITGDDERSLANLARQTDNLALSFREAKRDIAFEAIPTIAAAIGGLNELGIMPAAVREIVGIINAFEDLGDAIKIVSLDFSKFIGVKPGAVGAGKFKGQDLKAPEPSSVSPLGIFGKTLAPGSFDRAGFIEAFRNEEPGRIPVQLFQTFNGIRERDMPRKAGAEGVEAINRATIGRK